MTRKTKVIMVATKNVNELNEKQAKALLKDIMTKLDDLDGEDCLGSEGWRHYLGYGD